MCGLLYFNIYAGHRSVDRDLEAQAIVLTKDPTLQAQLNKVLSLTLLLCARKDWYLANTPNLAGKGNAV